MMMMMVMMIRRLKTFFVVFVQQNFYLKYNLSLNVLYYFLSQYFNTLFISVKQLMQTALPAVSIANRGGREKVITRVKKKNK